MGGIDMVIYLVTEDDLYGYDKPDKAFVDKDDAVKYAKSKSYGIRPSTWEVIEIELVGGELLDLR
jgi:hypothetical protein